MIIDTKFNVEDKVWIMNHNKPELVTVDTIRLTFRFTKNLGTKQVMFDLRSKAYDESTSLDKRMIERASDNCFATKKELLESFLDKTENLDFSKEFDESEN